MYKVGFILHGKSRRKKRFYKEFNKVRRDFKGLKFKAVETSQSGHANSLVMEFIDDGYTHLIAVGGDGTLHELINVILKNNGEEIIIGVLPYGSANDFVKTIHSPTNLTELALLIMEGKHQKIDIGKIEHTGGVEYFNNIADFGIGADVVKRVNNSSKLLGAGLAFYRAILGAFFRYKNKNVCCKADGWTKEFKMNSLVIANGKYFGNGMAIAPEAKLNDGKFQVVLIGDISTSDYLKNMNDVKSGNVLTHPKVSYRTAKKLEVTSTEKCGLEADGEFIGYAPAIITIEPAKINFLTV